MPAPANVIQQTTDSTGTGNLTLAIVNGRQEFQTPFGTGATLDVFDYFIMDRDSIDWERGTGHMSDATTLVRDTVLENSLGTTALINLGVGIKDATNDIPSASQAIKDVDGSYTAPQRGEIDIQGNVTGAITIDLLARNDFSYVTTGDINFANPTGIASAVGQKGTALVDNSGGHTLTSMGTQWQRIDGTGAPTLKTGDVRFDYHVVSATVIQYRYGEGE